MTQSVLDLHVSILFAMVSYYISFRETFFWKMLNHGNNLVMLNLRIVYIQIQARIQCVRKQRSYHNSITDKKKRKINMKNIALTLPTSLVLISDYTKRQCCVCILRLI